MKQVTEKILRDAEFKLRKARSELVLSFPFFGALALRQEVRITTDVETMATNGKELFANPFFVLDTPMPQLIGVVAHECLHPGLCHHVRRGDREPRQWNEATDLVINPILLEAGFELPEQALVDPDFTGMHAEDVYAARARPQIPPNDGGAGDDQSHGGEPSGSEGPSQGGSDDSDGEGEDDSQSDDQDDTQSDGTEGDQAGDVPRETPDQIPDCGGCGAIMDAPAMSEPERQQEESEWKVAMTQAANLARAAGDLPGSIERIVDELTNPKADWRDLLRRFMDQFAKADYTWETPNRRMIADGLYLPSLRSEQMPPFLFEIDASASMPPESLRQALSEVQAIVDELQPEFIDVAVHDTQQRGSFRFEPGDRIDDFSVKAGGGTKFGPVVDWIKEQPEDYAVVIWFTDLYVNDLHRVKELHQPVIFIDYACRGLKNVEVGEYVELHR